MRATAKQSPVRRDFARPQGQRHKVVLYNPQAVFFTFPLALLAIGSELDPEVYEVIIVDARLEPDAESVVLSHLDGALCVGITVLTGAPISDALRLSRAVKHVRPNVPVVWAAGILRCSRANACTNLRSTSRCVDRARRHSWRFCSGLRLVSSLKGCAGCTVRLADGNNSPEPQIGRWPPIDKFRAHDYNLIPVERYFELKGKRQLDYISSQGCNFRCAFCSDPFVYGRQVGRTGAFAHGAALEGTVGQISFR